MPSRKRLEEPINRHFQILIESDRILSEIDRRGLRSLNRLHEIAAPLPEDASASARRLPEAEGTFLVDKYINDIPFLQDINRDRKITNVRYAVCIARIRSNTKLSQYRGLIESKLQLKHIAKALKRNKNLILRDKLYQLHLAIQITENLAVIDRYESLFPAFREKLTQRRQLSRGNICEQTITYQLKALENGLAQSGTLAVLGRQLILKSDLNAGTKPNLQKRVFVSEMVGWWFRNTGKWPAKNYYVKATRAANDSRVNFYDFMEAARQDAGFTKISSLAPGASGPFERMVRDVISELQLEMDRRTPAQLPEQGD